ncbi:M28 family peptidase [Psychroserpens sp. MEBiC05023]
MKTVRSTLVCVFLCTIFSYAQTVQDIINQVDIDALTLTLNEFSGEQTTTVNGNMVTILNRQEANNELAGDYLVERFQALNNITVTSQSFNTNGRNIIATQVGKTNPNNIYIVCAHYDSVDDYCADDNVTGTGAVLEIARILSEQCLDNTIVYALWDEEEIGLRGSEFYANLAAANGDNILGVVNMDMVGYDGNNPGTPGDNDFDIDYRNIANSAELKDDMLAVLNAYVFDLNAIVVNPGTTFSDHASFWFAGNGTSDAISAILIGESWETDDQTPFYHTSGDRVSTLDLPYYHEIVKLVAGFMTTKGGLVAVDNTLTVTTTTLMSNESSASYQWFNCTTNTAISGATSQSFIPPSNGNYAVEVTSGNCTERSECIRFNTLGLDNFLDDDINIFPNPVQSDLFIEVNESIKNIEIKLYDVSGKLVLNTITSESSTVLNIKALPQGVYFLNLISSEKSGAYKIVKE